MVEYMPVLVLGVVLGLYELFAIHGDVNFRGSRWFGHGLHAILIMMIGLFAVFNWEYFLDITTLAERNIPFISNVLIGRVLIGIILNFKMHAVSAVVHGRLAARGMAEHWTHSLLISALVVAAPYYWPFVSAMLPAWMQG